MSDEKGNEAGDRLNAACEEVVFKAGGAKVVGAELWPDKPVNAAQKLLLSCLNEHRRERLTPEQLLALARIGRRIGCHALMDQFAAEAGYKALPVEPRDEIASLLEEANKLIRAQQAVAARLEKLIEQAPRLRVA